MTTAGEAVIGGGIVIGGDAVVGGASAGTGVIVVPGGSAVDLSRHTHVQAAPQTVWTLAHGKGRPPIAWVLRDHDGTECEGYTVQVLDANTARVSMEDPTAGTILMIF